MLKLIVPLAAVLATGGIMAGLRAQPAAEPAATAAPPAAAPAPAAPADPVASAARITAAEAKKVVDAGKAVLVDVRSAMSYQTEHAKGAINVPTYEMAARMSTLPKDKQIITYCT